jgi:hypothetical protein
MLPGARGPSGARFDPVGVLLSVAGITGLLYGFIEAPDDGWTSPGVAGPIVTGLAVLAGFAFWERRAAHPMLDPAFAANRKLLLGGLAIAGVYFALFGMYFDITQYFQLVRGYSPVVAALYALPAGLAQLVTANLGKRLAGRIGMRAVLAGGLAASAAGLLILTTSGVASSPWLFEAGLALLGAGIGLAMPPATGAIMSSLPPAKAGVGSAINDLVRELGGAFGVGLLGSLTLDRYRAAVTAHGLPAAARQGLAEAIAAAHGAGSTAHGTNSAARAATATAQAAFTSGLDIAMAVGAACALATAVLVAWKMPRASTPASSAPTNNTATNNTTAAQAPSSPARLP